VPKITKGAAAPLAIWVATPMTLIIIIIVFSKTFNRGVARNF